MNQLTTFNLFQLEKKRLPSYENINDALEFGETSVKTNPMLRVLFFNKKLPTTEQTNIGISSRPEFSFVGFTKSKIIISPFNLFLIIIFNLLIINLLF